jgi:hypothetical protein
MYFLTKEKLISLFDTTKSNLSLKQFIDTAKVRRGKTLVPLKAYIGDRIPMDDLKSLYLAIMDKDAYLSRFYDVSLKIPDSMAIDASPMKNKQMNNNALVNYKNVIRNMYYKEILKDTKSGIENNPTFFDVLSDLYLHNIIDYKILTPSAMFYMKNGRLGSVFSSFYFRASIMNPYLVYSLNQSVLKGTRVFTPTLGWGSYCYGFLESAGVTEYVGTDVIPSVCKKTSSFAKQFYPNKTVRIIESPSEKLAADKSFLSEYKNHFDVVFFSPPYYRLELYPGHKQSTTTYKTYEEWLAGYWEQTIRLCQHVLRPGGRLCYILSGYGTDGEYDLLNDMNNITQKYFKLKSRQTMYNKNVNSTEHRETSEQIMVWGNQGFPINPILT